MCPESNTACFYLTWQHIRVLNVLMTSLSLKQHGVFILSTTHHTILITHVLQDTTKIKVTTVNLALSIFVLYCGQETQTFVHSRPKI